MTTNELPFSPAPWRVIDNGDRQVIVDSHSRLIAFCMSNPDGLDLPNAKLIKKSPDMLEFLCDLVSACDYDEEELSDMMKRRAEKLIREALLGEDGR